MISYYFGYIPIRTVDGKITDDVIEQVRSLTGDDIIAFDGVSKVMSLESIIELTNGEDMIIPSEISQEELQELIDGGEKYRDIADSHNNCIVLMVPLKRYTSPRFDIIDDRMAMSITKQFCKVNCVEVNCEKYVLLCMFNDKWAYSRIGKDKIISPLKLIMKL